VFRSWFAKRKPELTGAPPVRRLKTYSAQSGYVYQYFYEGHRDYSGPAETGTEYVFRLSADRKDWHPTSVFLAKQVVDGWQAEHNRTLSSTECYAIAKLALFQAFDERPTPAGMQDSVRVRRADLDGIVKSLEL
jgi:hypothetical protein